MPVREAGGVENAGHPTEPDLPRPPSLGPYGNTRKDVPVVTPFLGVHGGHILNIPSLAPPVASPAPLPAVGGPAVSRGVGIGAAQRGPRSQGCTSSVSRPRARATPGKGTRISRGPSSWGSPRLEGRSLLGHRKPSPGQGKTLGTPARTPWPRRRHVTCPLVPIRHRSEDKVGRLRL